VVWEEGRKSREGLSKDYGRGDNSEEPAGQDSRSSFKDSGAIDEEVRDVVCGEGEVMRRLHVCHF
jgi:hypothetical protein